MFPSLVSALDSICSTLDYSNSLSYFIVTRSLKSLHSYISLQYPAYIWKSYAYFFILFWRTDYFFNDDFVWLVHTSSNTNEDMLIFLCLFESIWILLNTCSTLCFLLWTNSSKFTWKSWTDNLKIWLKQVDPRKVNNVIISLTNQIHMRG